MLSWIDLMAQLARYEDLLREAEKERFMRRLPAGRGWRGRLIRQALAWLGHRLVAWGCRLQERYDVASTAVHAPACASSLANR